MSEINLFGGAKCLGGGLSNEEQLALAVPSTFLEELNPWSEYASRMHSVDTAERDWTWENEDDDVRTQQRSCLTGILGSRIIYKQHIIAIAGWMLSEMLQKVPKNYQLPNCT